MSVPASNTEGSLGTVLVAPGGTEEFQDFVIPRGAERVTFFLRLSAMGPSVVEVLRIGETEQRMVPVRNIPNPPPADEVILDFDFPIRGRLRVKLTNNGGANLTASLEVAFARPGRR